MPPCEKKISTENGVLQCDQNAGHKGMHSATHDGGRIPYPDLHKNKDGDVLLQERPAIRVQWPQEGDNSPATVKEG